jgi:hypothetical protein
LELLVNKGRKKNKFLFEAVGKQSIVEKDVKLKVLHQMIDTFKEKGMTKRQIMNMLSREEKEMLQEEKFWEALKAEHGRPGVSVRGFN